MTPTTQSALRIVTFGDLASGVWGAVWSREQTSIALRAGETALCGPAQLDWGEASEAWKLTGDGVQITIDPVGEAVYNEPLDGFDQLARVSGRATVDGASVPIDALCRRAIRNAAEVGDADSIRDVSCWFEPDRGLALTAVRPRRTKGHDRDLVAAAVLDLEDGHAIADPRLSTTYAEDGLPARAGLELWRDEEENEEPQYPTRAAGEAAGAGLLTASDGAQLRAEPFRWHSRGAEGTGLYLLIRAR